MADAIDFELLGERLRKVRKDRKMTLDEVWKATGVSVPTLSRIECGDAKGLLSETLITLSNWIGTSARLWRKADAVDSTPDVVELHLRADKNLDRKTADALAQLFRAAYDQVKKGQRRG
jgi:transcriptional regulator with XRE-family HTH domain